MIRPELSFVDATILTALITPEPASDRVLQALRYGVCSWITSEISVADCLATLERRGLALDGQQACLDRLLLVLRHGIGLRPLPLQALRPRHPQPLPPLALLQLQTALHWRCSSLISNDPALLEAAKRAGLGAFSLMDPVPAHP